MRKHLHAAITTVLAVRRILLIPAVAALAVFGSVLFGVAGPASAATTAPAAQQAVIAHPTSVTSNSEYKWFKYDYYSSQINCDLAGEHLMGGSFDGGIIVDYSCSYVFGEGWLLKIEVWYGGCPGIVSSSPPAKTVPKAC